MTDILHNDKKNSPELHSDLNMYEPNNRAAQYVNQKLIEIKTE